ncbi:hypothetical protein [Enterococcus saccharolyticus]|nr:hypothetical protein [Enterococcus saccharolyticus]
MKFLFVVALIVLGGSLIVAQWQKNKARKQEESKDDRWNDF